MKYIIHKRGLIETLQGFNKAAEVYFPIKSNSNKMLILLIDQYVSGYEVESLYHARILIKTLGVSPNRILFSYQSMSLEKTNELLALQISHFAVDDVNRCRYLVDNANKLKLQLKIMLRLDIQEVLKTDLVVKWGASTSEITFMKEYLQIHNHHFEGISYYLPQEINDLKNTFTIIDFILNRYGCDDLKAINIGGGITPDNTVVIKKAIEAKYNKLINIFVEPGRTLLNPNIDLLVKIIDIRRKSNQKLLFIDSGIYSGLIDHIIKGRVFEIKALKNDSDIDTYLVCGNTSDISDIIGIYHLPADIKSGDELLIKNCGAYCSEMNMHFCENKRANYKIVD